MKNYLLIILLILSAAGCSEREKINSSNRIALSKAMGDTKDEGFDKAINKIKFNFPEDHGPHPGFKTEWWYFTGNLITKDNKKFGYQFTIFRSALSKTETARNSEWNSNQIYMSHFAVTDISDNEFFFEERFSREGNKLAGAQSAPFKVWLEDWQISETGDGESFGLPDLNIKAKNEKAEINFKLKSVKPAVLQGDSGLSQKGKQPGNASYYYSYTRLKTEGKIILDGKEYEVSGYSWMDREWSTSALSEDQKGWDWFALQLDDSTELMYYQMRKNDGSPDIYSKGILIEKDGTSRAVKKEDLVLEVTDNWTGPSGEKYPSGWRMKIPSMNIDLKITPSVKDQLMNVSIRYWEGSVMIEGIKNNLNVSGKGYAELTGY
ncbi:MAG: carotenoid 1,2-hydratase [Ignavibacteria bacterium]|nr:carotenoid 1,2-hydratase [Ignavibacteria bacterium]